MDSSNKNQFLQFSMNSSFSQYSFFQQPLKNDIFSTKSLFMGLGVGSMAFLISNDTFINNKLSLSQTNLSRNFINFKQIFENNIQNNVNNVKNQTTNNNIFRTIQLFSSEHGHAHGAGGCGCQKVILNPQNITGHFEGFAQQTHNRWVLTPRMHTTEENQIKKPLCVLKRVLGEEMVMDFKAFMNEEILLKDSEEKMTTLSQKLYQNMKFWMELEQFLKVKFGSRYIDHLLEMHPKLHLNAQYKSLAYVVTFVNKLRQEARLAKQAVSGSGATKATQSSAATNFYKAQ